MASQGCRYECTPIEGDAETAGLSSQELESLGDYERFNLVGDCVGQEHLECREVLPDACEVACGDSDRCLESGLRKSACNDIVSWR